MGAVTVVETATVAAEPMSVFVDALGTVTPEHTANIYSQVSGRVLSVNYSEGQMVTAGQSLVEVDPRPYQAQLAQAQGSLARDRALLEQAQTDAKRYQDALNRNAISQQTLYDQQATVKQYQAAIQNDEGSVQYDEIQLSYCHIAAPFSGRIGLRLVDPGNTIFAGSGNTLAVITQIDPITVVFPVAEDNVPRIRNRMRQTHSLPVEIYDRAQSSLIAKGQLLALDNQIDTTTGTVKFRARFHNPNGGVLFPNQFVNARLLVNTIPDALQLPTSAIQYNGQQAFVYVISNGKAHLQNIKVDNENDNNSSVEGLTAGTVVANSNFDRIEDGAEVASAPARPAMRPTGGRP
jgi:multidrug efflux system membrane fusion protein